MKEIFENDIADNLIALRKLQLRFIIEVKDEQLSKAYKTSAEMLRIMNHIHTSIILQSAMRVTEVK